MKVSRNNLFLKKRKRILRYSGPTFAFFPYQQPKRKFLKNENHFTYVCHGNRMYSSCNTTRDRKLDVKSDILMGL